MVMNDGALTALVREPRVTIEAAANLTGTDGETLRMWVGRGVVNLERRGDMEVVRLSEVQSVASRQRKSSRDALRRRLRDGTVVRSDPAGIEDLQNLARERTVRKRR